MSDSAAPWTAARQASLSFTISQSLLKYQQRLRWLDGITDSMDKFEQAPGAGDGQGSLVCCSPRGRKELDMIELMHWVSDAIQPSHSLLLPSSPPALNLSQHQGLFQWVSSSNHHVYSTTLIFFHQIILSLFLFNNYLLRKEKQCVFFYHI